jgi:hypothetical protein
MGESSRKQTPWRSRVIGQREMPVAELTANPANWRRHPETQTEALIGAIEEIGFVVPVIFNTRTGRLYGLIVTAKMNDIDPQAWLADVLARIAEHPAQRLDELLPWNWKNAAAAITLAA